MRVHYEPLGMCKPTVAYGGFGLQAQLGTNRESTIARRNDGGVMTSGRRIFGSQHMSQGRRTCGLREGSDGISWVDGGSRVKRLDVRGNCDGRGIRDDERGCRVRRSLGGFTESSMSREHREQGQATESDEHTKGSKFLHDQHTPTKKSETCLFCTDFYNF